MSNIVSGALWLLLLAAPRRVSFDSWELFLIGAAYVTAGSVFLAAVYTRDVLTKGQEAMAWIAPWVVAVALWALIGARIDGENSGAGWFLALWFGFSIGTPCYLVWQIVALAIRQLMSWRSRGALSRASCDYPTA